MNFKVIGLTRPEFEPIRSESVDLPKQETDALLIQPSRLVIKMTGGYSNHLATPYGSETKPGCVLL